MGKKLRVVNIGISSFYDALTTQDCEAVQVDWRPPVKISQEMNALVERTMTGELAAKIDEANEAAADLIIQADPAWVDVLPAGEVVEGLDDYVVTHSGPPIAFEDMVMLHQRGMVSACLFEGWAKTEEEALELIRSGKIKMISALDTNTVGAGTGIITKNVAMIVTKDRNSGKIAATFPAEGIVYQGGFCGWGLYSEGIAENLRHMREYLLPPMAEMVRKRGGLQTKPILVIILLNITDGFTHQCFVLLIYLIDLCVICGGNIFPHKQKDQFPDFQPQNILKIMVPLLVLIQQVFHQLFNASACLLLKANLRKLTVGILQKTQDFLCAALTLSRLRRAFLTEHCLRREITADHVGVFLQQRLMCYICRYQKTVAHIEVVYLVAHIMLALAPGYIPDLPIVMGMRLVAGGGLIADQGYFTKFTLAKALLFFDNADHIFTSQSLSAYLYSIGRAFASASECKL